MKLSTTKTLQSFIKYGGSNLKHTQTTASGCCFECKPTQKDVLQDHNWRCKLESNLRVIQNQTRLPNYFWLGYDSSQKRTGLVPLQYIVLVRLVYGDETKNAQHADTQQVTCFLWTSNWWRNWPPWTTPAQNCTLAISTFKRSLVCGLKPFERY